MRAFVRFLWRGAFVLVAVALLYGMRHHLTQGGVSLYTENILPLSRATTPAAQTMVRPLAAAAILPVEQPAPEPEREPPVEGDILALMYHDLTEDPRATTDWTTTAVKFREDITSLLDAGYLPLSISDWLDGNTVRGQDYFIVTFDDGYTSNLTLALPILTELSVPATVFVITGSVDIPSHMDWDALAELTSSGLVTVYSHTDSHTVASKTTLAAFLADEQTAQEKLSTHLATERKILAYPEGGYTRASMEALAADGYELFVIQEKPRWYVDGGDMRILVRHNVEDDANMMKIVARNRVRDGIPTLATATALRAARAAEDEAARLAQCRASVAYQKARMDEAADKTRPTLLR